MSKLLTHNFYIFSLNLLILIILTSSTTAVTTTVRLNSEPAEITLRITPFDRQSFFSPDTNSFTIWNHVAFNVSSNTLHWLKVTLTIENSSLPVKITNSFGIMVLNKPQSESQSIYSAFLVSPEIFFLKNSTVVFYMNIKNIIPIIFSNYQNYAKKYIVFDARISFTGIYPVWNQSLEVYTKTILVPPPPNSNDTKNIIIDASKAFFMNASQVWETYSALPNSKLTKTCTSTITEYYKPQTKNELLYSPSNYMFLSIALFSISTIMYRKYKEMQK